MKFTQKKKKRVATSSPGAAKKQNITKAKSSLEKLDELSVFYPAYNEGERIAKTIENTFVHLPKVATKYEVVVVNDGSKDDTEQVVNKLMKKYKELKIVTHNPNRGYGEALKTGFANSKYEWVVFTDSDGQFDFGEITNFIDTQKKTGADLVIGYYKDRAVPFYRKFNSYMWQLIVYILFGLKVRDIDCAFKLINQRVIKAISPLESGRGAFISSEFLIKAQKKGFKIVEIPITHYPRVGGQGTGANLDVIMQSFVDLFSLWKKLKNW